MYKLTSIFIAMALLTASCAADNIKGGKRFIPSADRTNGQAGAGVQANTAKLFPVTMASKAVNVPQAAPVPLENAAKFDADMRTLTANLTKNLTVLNPKGTTVVVATFVPDGNYEKTELFGKVAASQVTSGLLANGFKVRELRKSSQLLIRDKDGIFSLSERLANIKEIVPTDLIAVGTYAMVGGELLINAYLISASGNEVLSSATAVMSVHDNSFIKPLIEPLVSHSGQWNPTAMTGGEGLRIRERINEKTDPSSKVLSLKIDKLSIEISKNLKRKNLKKIIISTYVDMDRFYTTNTFGRFVTERLMDRVSRSGFDVIEVRAAKELMVQPNIGEMALSRDIDEMMGKYQGEAMLLGTYKKVGDTVFVHTRLIVSDNQEVVSVASMEMGIKENDAFMQAMFEKQLDRTAFQGGSGGIAHE